MSQRPPLTMRLRPGFWLALDGAAAAFYALPAFLLTAHAAAATGLLAGAGPGRYLLALLLAAGLALPMALRRRWPLPALATALAMDTVTTVFGGQFINAEIVPLAFTLYLVAAVSSRRAALAGLAAALALLIAQGAILTVSGLGFGASVGAGLFLVITWLAGNTMQQRRSYAAHLREQAADTAVTAERLRIARELHDVVAHSMTVVAVQAGFGEYVFDSQPAQARASLAAIQSVTREALADMQRLLGVLRQAGEDQGRAGRDGAGTALDGTALDGTALDGQGHTGPPLAPAPGLAGLERLASGTAAAGVQAEIRYAGQARSLPPGIDLSAFRIVQEALTNVVKHSGADRCTVAVGYRPGALTVEITDPGPADGSPPPAAAGGSGHGITGMRERVSLCGGQFSAGPLPDRGFRVWAQFPLAESAR